MAWDFAAEIHSLANYNADDASTTGTSGEVLSDHATQWLTDGAKEIINQLPSSLKTKCATATELDNSPLVMDMDGVGDVLFVTRLSADSGGYQIPCREIPSMYGGLTEDSNDLNYFGTVTDPVYWIDGNNSDAVTLYVKPTLTSAQKAYVHHISYPTVAFNSTAIANFPDEAEYLVVLYAATKACLYQMALLNQTDTALDTTALGAIVTELNKADDVILAAHGKVGDFYTSIDDIDNTTAIWDNTNKNFAIVHDALNKARSLITDDAEHAALGDVTDEPSGGYSALTHLGNEDTEMVASTLSIVNTELSRAGVIINELNTIMASYSLELQGVSQYMSTASGYISQAAGYVGEVQVRMGRANQKYTWYDAQYAKLSAEYSRGLAALKGGGE